MLANKQKERLKEEAMVQKARLSDLFGDRERPKWSKKTTMKVFLLSSNFVFSWRAFIKGRLAGKAGFEDPITDLNNAVLLCEHQGLLHPPTIAWEVDANSSVVMITEEEMAVVRDLFNVDVEIRVDRENEMGGPVLTSTPAPCSICVASRQEAEQEDRLRSGLIYCLEVSYKAKLFPLTGTRTGLSMSGGFLQMKNSQSTTFMQTQSTVAQAQVYQSSNCMKSPLPC